MSVINLNTRFQQLAHERDMSGAPRAVLPNGKTGVPQHYKTYNQTVDSLSKILSEIEFHPMVLFFTGRDHNGLYLQVGIIGHENYGSQTASKPAKLVYGRKWRIDADTPSSEVIQTAYLAAKKAREHEVRELLTLRNTTNKISAPFSSHQDISLMAKYQHSLMSIETADMNVLNELKTLLARIKFDGRKFSITSTHTMYNKTFVDIKLKSARNEGQGNTVLSEFDNFETTLILNHDSRDSFVFDLVDALIRHSDDYVSENFIYGGFIRFSRKLDPFALADFSVASRPYKKDMEDEDFARIFQESNFNVDASRVPHIGEGKLAQINLARIVEYDNLAGHMPDGYQAKTDTESCQRMANKGLM